MSAAPAWWRHVALAGLVGGLLASTTLAPPGGWLILTPPAALALAWLRPRRVPGGRADVGSVVIWLALVAVTAALAGLGVGAAREGAIASGAAPGRAGEPLEAIGFVTTQPRRSGEELRMVLELPVGRLVLVAEGPIPAGLTTGSRVSAAGTLAEPPPWRRGELDRAGAGLELRADRLELLRGGRSGIAGLLDRARGRAERGIEAGLGESQAALARGFVLGQDELIDPATRERFRRSGLAHLLAVSGQNVILLAILTGVLLALAGIGPRLRLVVIVAAIAAYVPLAGAGPSIQRAGVMGAAGILAGLLGRPADRAYLPLLAAAATLCLNPHSAADVGWQLSFAAVLGIAALSAPLRARSRLPLERLAGRRLGAPLADGIGLTLAATIATAPLMAHHFGSFSIASLPANLLVLPAVAPVMWLGMLAAVLGQFPFIPVAPIGAIEAVLLDYIDAVAALLAAPPWAIAEAPLAEPASVALVYAALIATAAVGLSAAGLRAGLRLRRRLRLGIAAAAVVLTLLLLVVSGNTATVHVVERGTLRMTILDVGQGDAILLQPAGAPAVLVDTGPPGIGLHRMLAERGVDRLGAVIITHDQSDHSGGLDELAGSLPIGRILRGLPAPAIDAVAARYGIPGGRLSAGDGLRWGTVRARALWPPAGLGPPEDPNDASVVLAVEFRGWSLILTGDAEFESTHLNPGPLDVLKLPHHGSADAALAATLDRSAPRLAVIGVGADNPHGHPAPETLASLQQRGVCVLRTDLNGAIRVDLARSGLRVAVERDAGGASDACSGRAG